MPFCQLCGERTTAPRALVTADRRVLRVCAKCMSPEAIKKCDLCMKKGHDRMAFSREKFGTDQHVIVGVKRLMYEHTKKVYPIIVNASEADRADFLDFAYQHFLDAIGDREVCLCTKCHEKIMHGQDRDEDTETKEEK